MFRLDLPSLKIRAPVGHERENHEQRLGLIFARELDADDRALDILIRLLEDEDSIMRLWAANGLGIISDERAVEPVIKALTDEDEDVRREAAFALGVIGDSRAVYALKQALEDRDLNVHREAALTLRSIRARES